MIDVVSTSLDCRSAIEAVVGHAHVHDASAEDAVDGVRPRWIVAPGSTAEMGGLLRVANENGLRVIPRGGGTKIDWGNPPTGADIVLSTERLDRVLEHAFGDMTATVQAGCTVAEFNRNLAAHEQRLAVDPLWPANATIGGILAVNDSGALRATFGALRDQLIGITVALADGTIAKSGGKVVKNVAGFDLPKLFTGSFGTLGVIVEATFRLYPCPKANRAVRYVVPEHDGLGRVLTAMNAKSSLTTAVQIEAQSDGPLSIAMYVEGLADAIDEKVRRVDQAALDVGAIREDFAGDMPSARESLFGDGLVTPTPVLRYSEEPDRMSKNPDLRSTSEPASLVNGPVMKRGFGDADTCVCKISILTTQWPDFLNALQSIATPAGVQWRVVGQAMGVGLLGLRGATHEQLCNVLLPLREYLGKSQGSLVILRGSREVKGKIDAWPKSDNALPLMRRIKEQFDPNRILSPGRFIGGI